MPWAPADATHRLFAEETPASMLQPRYFESLDRTPLIFEKIERFERKKVRLASQHPTARTGDLGGVETRLAYKRDNQAARIEKLGLASHSGSRRSPTRPEFELPSFQGQAWRPGEPTVADADRQAKIRTKRLELEKRKIADKQRRLAAATSRPLRQPLVASITLGTSALLYEAATRFRQAAPDWEQRLKDLKRSGLLHHDPDETAVMPPPPPPPPLEAKSAKSQVATARMKRQTSGV